MISRLGTLLRSRTSIVGIIAGARYGIVSRLVAEAQVLGGLFVVMSLGFIFVVPLVLGVLAVSTVEAPSWRYRFFAPWVPMTLVIISASLLGLEGAICVFMSLPALLLLSSVGGMVGGSAMARLRGVRPAFLALPLIVGSLEQRLDTPTRLVETVTEILIAAPPSVVWPLVASVDSIRAGEQRPALFTRLGFPRPVSATINGEGVGAVRSARFEGGLVFTETVTEWAPGVRLSFSIDPNTESIPATTLDPHVTIGGPFFAVLTDTYELESSNGGRATRLVLRSQHRVSTQFNVYAGWWAHRIMASIQENILAVHKARAERRPGSGMRHGVRGQAWLASAD